MTGATVRRLVVGDPDAMHALGRELAGVLRAGDLVLLGGPLGAGKTTLTRGVGAGLQVRGAVSSPTFVIARLHPSTVGGPGLLHVDAYRLGSLAELDDLDLDTDLASCVTVVEWGEGLAERLSGDRLEIRVDRPVGDPGVPPADRSGDAATADAADARTVTITAVGRRWRDVALPGAGLA